MDIAGLLGWLAILAMPGWGQLLVAPAESANNPNVRMKQLLNQTDRCGSEHLVKKEWQRMGDADQPSHLHPERIQGGIQ